MRHAFVGLALLSLAGCDLGTEEGAPAAEGVEAAPEVVAVDWLGRGTLYAATVSGRRGEFTRVEYADGDHEWVDGSRLQAWPDLTGRRVQFYTGTRSINVTVEESREGLFHVRFDDGADTWISPEMLYRLEAPPPQDTGQTAPGDFPPRAAVDPSQVTVGATVLAYWVSNGELQRARPWRARVVSRSGETVHLAYMDGSEADLPVSAVLRVFAGGAPPSMGQRYWLAGEHPVGTVLEQRAGLTKLQVGANEAWVEGVAILAPCPAVEPARLVPGTFVTALWNGSALYHGTVVSVEAPNVTLAWHDGSEPSAVALTDVLEVWSPVPQ